MRLWRKLANPSAAAPLPRGIARAALAGATLENLLQEVYWSLEGALRGKADRFGVWLAPISETGQSSAPGGFEKRFWTHGRPDDAPESHLPEHFLPLPKSLVAGGPAVEQELDRFPLGIRMAPPAGIRRALWVPVRLGPELQGVLFAAARKSSVRFPREEMERAAAELAVVLGFRVQSAMAQARAADLAEAQRIWSEISAGASRDPLLQKITNSSIESQGNTARAARFATLGILTDGRAQQSSAEPALDFRWSAGDHVLARLADSEPVASIWRKALETRTVVGSAMPSRQCTPEIARVVAIPLLISGHVQGVLVAGYPASSATLANLERLELRASLASAALAVSARQRAPQQVIEASQFLMQNVSDPVFLINSRQEITAANSAGRALLPAAARNSPRQDTPLRQAAASLGTAAQIFKPAEWSRLSAWLDTIADSAASPAAHSIATELPTGRPVQLHAAALPAGGFTFLLQEAAAREEPAAIRATRELHSLIEWIDQGILLFDENETLRAMNQRFAQIFGLLPEDLENATGLRALIGLLAARVADPGPFAARWWDAAAGVPTSLREEVRVLQPVPRLVERISRPVLDAAGVRLGRVEIYRDLTTQQLFQSKLHNSERLAALGQNVSSVAHELSNPLTTILGYAQRLLRTSADSAHRDDIQRIFSEADRASSILRQLLGSAREAPPERLPLDLNSLILRTVELQRFQLASEKIRLDLDLAPALPPVRGDSGQLQQILMNLISNARHALRDRKPRAIIRVRTCISDSGRVIVEVSDSGPGIPEAHRHRIFDPFFTTKPAGLGTGLGLSIVMGLVQQNGGNIRLQNAVGQGATFSIDFPAANAAPALPVPDRPAARVAIPAGSSGRVLVVEDEPTVAQLIADMLSDLGYSSDILHDVRRALVSALNRDYALVVCDMKMPVLDGQHFYRALAEAGSPLASRFLFVTGDVLGTATREFLRKHRLPHIGKPFRLEEFVEKVALVLGQSAAAGSPPGPVLPSLSSKNLRSHG